MYDTIANLSVKCTARRCKLGFFLETTRLTSEVHRLLAKVIRKHYVYKQKYNTKVINKLFGSELAFLCIAIHYQDGIKISVNKCGLSLRFSSVEKNLFSARQPVIFLLSFAC